MNFVTRLFHKEIGSVAPIVTPDDSRLREELERAKMANHEASVKLAQAATRQIKDAQLVREVISGVLIRVDQRSKQQS